MRDPTRWTALHAVDSKAVLIQKVWRGYSVRSWLTLAGPGVLKRSLCHNEEELVTMDESSRTHPFDYFAFAEAEKVYWFDVRTIAQNSTLTLNPTNPYTREPLSMDTRQRLRKVCIRRQRRKMSNVHTVVPTRTYLEASDTTWITICQILGENGFVDVAHEYFTSLNRTQLYVFLSMLRQDMIAWGAEHTSRLSRRHKYTYWINRVLEEYVGGAHVERMGYIVSRVVLTILNDYPDPYPICFILMSCLSRL